MTELRQHEGIGSPPGLALEINFNNPKQSHLQVDISGNRRVALPYDYGPQHPISVLERAMDVQVTYQHGLSDQFKNFFLELIQTGNINPAAGFVVVRQDGVPVTRKLTFAHPDDPYSTYTAGGIGLGVTTPLGVVFDRPNPIPLDINALMRQRHLPTMGTPVINKQGRLESDVGQDPQGAYFADTLTDKRKNTDKAKSLQLGIATPEFKMTGIYKGNKFRDKDTAWAVYPTPLLLDTDEMAHLGLTLDDLPEARPNNVYGTHNLFQYWNRDLARFVRHLNNRKLVHNQLHARNKGKGVVPDMNRAVVTDWATLRSLADYPSRSTAGSLMSPLHRYFKLDLGIHMWSSLQASLNALIDADPMEVRLTLARNIAWMEDGYIRPDQTQNEDRIEDRINDLEMTLRIPQGPGIEDPIRALGIFYAGEAVKQAYNLL